VYLEAGYSSRISYFKHREAFNFIKPSRRVVEHSKKYRENFLGEDGFVVVALRTLKN